MKIDGSKLSLNFSQSYQHSLFQANHFVPSRICVHLVGVAERVPNGPTPEELVKEFLKKLPEEDRAEGERKSGQKDDDDEKTAQRKRLMKLLDISQKEINELRRKAEAGELKDAPSRNRWVTFDSIVYMCLFVALLYGIEHDYGISPSMIFKKILPRETKVVLQLFSGSSE